MAQSSTGVEALGTAMMIGTAMMNRFGGVEGLADALKSPIDAATARYPGSRAVGILLQCVVHMVEEGDRAKAESIAEIEENVSRMSTEELERLVEGYRERFRREGYRENRIDPIIAEMVQGVEPDLAHDVPAVAGMPERCTFRIYTICSG